MKKFKARSSKILLLFSAMLLTLALTACGGPSYKSIVSDYTKQMEEAGPQLLQEYKDEAAELDATDMTGRAELATAKVMELANIHTEGTKQLAQLKDENGDSEEYEDAVDDLYDIYEDQAQAIYDAYLQDTDELISDPEALDDYMDDLNDYADDLNEQAAALNAQLQDLQASQNGEGA